MKIGKSLTTISLGSIGGLIAFCLANALTPKKTDQISRLNVVSPVAVQQVAYEAKSPSVPGLPGTVDLRDAARTTVPTVVHVTNVQMGREYIRDPFLEFFFGGSPRAQESPQRMGIGSGVIISEDGYIITNNHVIDRSDKITVTLNNNKEYPATVVGKDPNTDIALIKIEETGLPYIQYGDSDDVELGEWVLAVGNPYNLTSTVTAGIISAKARDLGINRTEMRLESFLQTDAAVNSGNSGGALVNARGELIGINTAIGSPTGNFSGYAFAVPSNIARKVVEDLKNYGMVQRAIVGIAMKEVDGGLAEELGMSEVGGIYVEEVLNGGAAEKAGLKKGDIIKYINGIEVSTIPAFQGQLGKFSPGTAVTMRVLRNDKEQDFSVLLQDIKSLEGNSMTVYGATVKSLTANERNRYRINGGVRIEDAGNGPLKAAGLQKGYIIVKVDRTTIRTAEDLLMELKSAENEGVLITAISPRGRVEYFAFSLQN